MCVLAQTLRYQLYSNLSPPTCNLQKIKRVEKSHGTFITGLEFLPTSLETDPIRGFSDASVVIFFVPKKSKSIF
jgi:hypothetical protein